MSLMKEKYLIVSDSALELLLTIQLKLSLLKEKWTTLVITDRTAGSFERYEILRDVGLFERVIYVKVSDFPSNKRYREYNEPQKSFEFRRACVEESKAIVKDYNEYTGFISSEIDFFTQYMFEMIKEHARPFHMSEGILAFYGIEEGIKHELSLRRVSYLETLRHILYYGPKLRSVSGYKMIQIPSINNNRDEYVDIINKVFGYESHKRKYEGKIIVFEESYSRDGGSDNLAEIVSHLIEHYGPDMVKIKRHPRSLENRFNGLGVEMIEPFLMPWELFSLNGDCDGCICLSANSGSVYLQKIWDFSKGNQKCIMLNNVMEYRHVDNPMYQMYYASLREVYKRYGIPSPTSLEELYKMISESLGR